MTINIVCTSKPCDGLLYYSYEYSAHLNALGISSNVVIVCHRKFSESDYVLSLNNKYVTVENVIFDNFVPKDTDVTLIMGRSQMTLAFLNFKSYTPLQQNTLRQVFLGDIIAVYSENHPTKYPLAINFFSPKRVVDLCDTDVYPNGIGEHFEKRINFKIYKPLVTDIKFKFLFLGTNEEYYKSVQNVIIDFPDHGILTYNEDYVNKNNNNVFVPVVDLMSIFETYVYTKSTFDPAPRIIQECKFFNKNIIYKRDRTLKDGGSVYWNREVKDLNVEPILNSIEELNENKAKMFTFP
jgi:hypothetical protein